MNGENFAELASKYCEDTSNASQDEDLGWFGRGAMVSEFEQAAFSQPIGEIGEPVQTQFGYHIIQVIAREELPLTSSQYDQKKETAFNDWLTAAKEEATVETFELWKERVPTEPALQTQQGLPQ